MTSAIRKELWFPYDPETARALLARGAETLAAYKRPRLVHVIGELPRNALGKVQKHLLASA